MPGSDLGSGSQALGPSGGRRTAPCSPGTDTVAGGREEYTISDDEQDAFQPVITSSKEISQVQAQ